MRRACLAFAIAVGVAGCGSSTSHNSQSRSTSTAASGAAAPAACTVAAPKPKGPQHLAPPQVKLDPARTYTVTVVTNCGKFAFTLGVKQSPKTSASIYYLVKRGFYNGLTFHRVGPRGS